MERRLIFFSGGVESTALLSLSKPDDIVVTIVDTPGNKLANSFGDVDIDKVKKIAKYYNRFVYFTPVHIPIVEIEEGCGVHQINVFFEIANNWARIKGKTLKEVWNGQSHAEYEMNWPNKKLRDEWQQCWDILHPNIKYHYPLGHLTKRQCWDMITDEVKPFIHYCRKDPPGKPDCQCQKCVRHRKMLAGEYDGPWRRDKTEDGKLLLVDPSNEGHKYNIAG
jgi:7-cyano-7-deazaguanine synthase in queuosine biosynthesis